MRPFLLLLLVLGLPLMEIAGFVLVGGEIGVLATIALIVGTGLVGSILLRIQGFGILSRIRADLEAGRNPGREVAHGVMVVAAGMLLIIPGFFTDVLGVLLFLAPVRDLAWRTLRRLIMARGSVSSTSGFDCRREDGGRSWTIDLDRQDYSANGDADLRRIDGDRT